MGRLGAHVSIAGGIRNSISRALKIGCDSFQIFSGNQRQWDPPPPNDYDVADFRRALRSSGLGPILVHGSYLLNPASNDEKVREKTAVALVAEIDRCELLGLDRLVMHPGSHLGNGVEEGISRITATLDNVLDISDGEVLILLETTAGQGSSIGSNIEELSQIIDGADNKDRLGVCLDTCHMYSAGYDLGSKENYEKIMASINSLIGIEKVQGIHLNDSKKIRGSGKDRHSNIGEGNMGLEPFRNIVNDERFENVPMILETPGGPEYYGKELQLLRSLKEV